MPLDCSIGEAETVHETDNGVELLEGPEGYFHITSHGVRGGTNPDVVVEPGDLAELLEVMLNGE